jgi:predicted Zn-dependent peptidase
LGDCLRGLDGVFDVAEKFSFIRKYNLPLSYFNDIQNTILEIKPEDLRNLAQKYLDFEQMTKVIVCDRTLLE